jgi:hypothetical protein
MRHKLLERVIEHDEYNPSVRAECGKASIYTKKRTCIAISLFSAPRAIFAVKQR